MQPLGPVRVVALFPGERERLLALLGALSAAEWAAGTACAGWSVHDVALHVLGGDLGNLSGGRDGFVDRRATAGVDFSHWEQLLAFIDRRNDDWLRATRRLSPRLVCELLAVTGPALYEYFRQLDLDAVGMPVNWAGPAPAPVWLHVAREYTERWLHQQHIRDAVGRPGLKERIWFAPVLDTFARALPYTVRGVAAPVGTILRLRVTGEAGGVWQVVRVDEGWALSAAADEPAAATLILDQETAWRLFTRGLSGEEARARATLAGDTALAATMLGMVAILA